MKKLLKNSYSNLCILMFLIIIISIIISVIQLNSELVQPTQFISNTDYSDCNYDVNLNGDNNTFVKDYPDLKGYIDIIVAVFTAIIVALISITVTIYVFMKSALDRIIDENNYIKSIANEYKRIMSKCLSNYCALSFFGVITIIGYHVYFCSKTSDGMGLKLKVTVIIGISIILITNIIMSVIFWKKCIKTEEQLYTIIINKSNEIKTKLEIYLNKNFTKSNINFLINEWNDFLAVLNHSNVDSDICLNINKEKFINIFENIKLLILSNDNSYIFNLDVLGAIQERKNMFKANKILEEKDLLNRKYISHNETNIYDSINNFCNRIGLSSENDFDEFEKLYIFINECNDLINSSNYINEAIQNSKRKKINIRKNNSTDLFNNENINIILEKALLILLFKVYSTAINSKLIASISLNGFSFNYANFYSSTLEKISWYSSDFYRTNFERARLRQTITDMSQLYDIDFYNTEFEHSSFNKSKLEYVIFEKTSAYKTGFDSCLFNKCKYTDSSFKNCNFNNVEFNECLFEMIDFTGSSFKDIDIINSDLSNNIFSYSTIHNWTIISKERPNFERCDFSNSIWKNMKVINWIAIGSNFANADLSFTEFSKTNLKVALFFQSDLSNCIIDDCQFHRASLEKTVLFCTKLTSSNLKSVNLIDSKAVKAVFNNCNLSNSNCADSEFSEAKFIKVNLNASRLYNCSMVSTKFYNCKCRYLISNHLRFTYAKCNNVDFGFSTLNDSNYAKSCFYSCKFIGNEMKKSAALKTKFINCIIENVDFSETNFTGAVFKETNKIYVIRNCNFFACCFDGVIFENVVFKNCLFEKAVISNSKIVRKNHYSDFVDNNNINNLTDNIVGLIIK